MSDTQDKTEQATSRRREDAAEQGQIAYSRELVAAALFLSGLGCLQFVGADLVKNLGEALVALLSLPLDALDEKAPTGFLTQIAGIVARTSAPILGVALIATIAIGLAQTRFSLAQKRLAPDFQKVSPATGLRRIFSTDSLVTLVTSLLKMTIVGLIVWTVVVDAMPRIGVLSAHPIEASMTLLIELVFLIGFRVGWALVGLGVIDLFYRHWKLSMDLKMSKEEVKEERKRQEGDPRIKGKIREVQRAIALRRMRTDLKSADVLVRNPTHFAVALKYDRAKDSSPRVVAKGQDLLALALIDLAREFGIEIIENRPLARELYRSVKLGDLVPERLFRAVAEVLAFVYRKRRVAKQPAAARAGSEGVDR